MTPNAPIWGSSSGRARPSWARTTGLLLVVLVAVGWAPTAVEAQSGISTLVVRVSDERGQPVPQATVTLATGTATRLVRVTGDDGTVGMSFTTGGRATVSVRRIGYTPAEMTVDLSGTVQNITMLIVRFATMLERVQIVGQRSVGGIVASRTGQLPIAGAKVRFTGTAEGALTTDSAGMFALPIGTEQRVTFEVSAPGYQSRVIAERMEPATMSRELLILLEASGDVTNLLRSAVDDRSRRLRWQGRENVVLGGRELRATGAQALGDAVVASGSVREKGLRVTDATCVVVDGIPQPGRTIGSYPTRNVLLMEVYGPGGDYWGTLADLWPKKAPCGTGEARRSPDEAVWVVIWTQQ